MSYNLAGDPLVEVTGLTHAYPVVGGELVALQDVDLSLAEGERLAVVGPSGSGKSALLRVLAGLERPRAGRVRVAEHDLTALNGAGRDEHCRRVTYMGRQADANLWPALTAQENAQLPLAGMPNSAAGLRFLVEDLLNGLGLSGRETRRPPELTRAERRRLALAVALAPSPRLLLADDPLAGLDDEEAEVVRACLDDVLRRLGTSLIVATRDHRTAPRVDWVIELPAARSLRQYPAPGRSVPSGVDPGRTSVLIVDQVRVTGWWQGQPVVLDEASFQVREAEVVAVLGGSEAERSALLDVCGGLQAPDAGWVTVAGDRGGDVWRNVGRLPRHGPPPSLTVAESVSFAARVAGASLRDSGRLVAMVLKATGLEHHAATPVDRLSAWEGRCAALARALARVPALLIADEPTAGLDTVAAGAILVLLRDVAASGVAVLLGTREPVVAEIADRVLLLADGRVREVQQWR